MTDSRDAPPLKRRRRSPEEIQERLLDAASIEFTARGYSEATTAAIARRAEVTEAQLFRCFPSKSELFVAAIFKPLNRHFTDFHSRVGAARGEAAGIEAQASAYIDELRGFIQEHAGMLMSLLVARTYLPEEIGGGASDVDGLRTYFDRGAAMMRQRLGGGAPARPELSVRVSFAAVLACVLFKDLIFPPELADDATRDAAVRDFVVEGLGMGAKPAARRSRAKS